MTQTTIIQGVEGLAKLAGAAGNRIVPSMSNVRNIFTSIADNHAMLDLEAKQALLALISSAGTTVIGGVDKVLTESLDTALATADSRGRMALNEILRDISELGLTSDQKAAVMKKGYEERAKIQVAEIEAQGRVKEKLAVGAAAIGVIAVAGAVAKYLQRPTTMELLVGLFKK